MKAELKFDLPEDNKDFECSIYASQIHQALENIRAKVSHNLERQDIPDQRKQIYAEINNMLIDELLANGIAHLF